MKLNSRQKKTLAAIFEKPERADVEWSKVESLLAALGASIDRSRDGSRIGVFLRGERAVFHAPRPKRVCGKGMVRDIRRFIERAGVSPEEVE